jgi:hypothetical protein
MGRARHAKTCPGYQYATALPLSTREPLCRFAGCTLGREEDLPIIEPLLRTLGLLRDLSLLLRHLQRSFPVRRYKHHAMMQNISGCCTKQMTYMTSQSGMSSTSGAKLRPTSAKSIPALPGGRNSDFHDDTASSQDGCDRCEQERVMIRRPHTASGEQCALDLRAPHFPAVLGFAPAAPPGANSGFEWPPR